MTIDLYLDIWGSVQKVQFSLRWPGFCGIINFDQLIKKTHSYDHDKAQLFSKFIAINLKKDMVIVSAWVSA